MREISIRIAMAAALSALAYFGITQYSRFVKLANNPEIVFDSSPAGSCRPAKQTEVEVTDKAYQPDSFHRREENFLFVRGNEFSGKVSAGDSVFAQVSVGDKIKLESGFCTNNFYYFFHFDMPYQRIILNAENSD